MQSNEVKRRKGMKSVVQLILCGHIHWRWTKGRRKERTDGRTNMRERDEGVRNPHGKHTHSWIMGLPPSPPPPAASGGL